MKVAALVVIAVALAAGAARAGDLVPERVAFDSLDVDRATGQPVRIEALAFAPAGRQSGRRPAVIVLHGCGGLYSTSPARRGRLTLRHEAMAKLLVAEGYVVLFPDSFRSRGQDEVCTVEYRAQTITQTQRRLDAQGALAHLQARADVLPDRIALLGWSHGGSTVLATVNARQPAVAAWGDRAPPAPYFRAAIAFYPGCYTERYARVGYSLAAPLLLFVAGSDDWTAPQPCIELAWRMYAMRGPIDLTVYPDAYHGFDGPAAQKPLHLDVPNGVHPGQGVTVAPNPTARADAYAKVTTFLRERLDDAPGDGGNGRWQRKP